MRTNVVIDDRLIEKGKRLYREPYEKELVDLPFENSSTQRRKRILA